MTEPDDCHFDSLRECWDGYCALVKENEDLREALAAAKAEGARDERYWEP